ncbi:uncharacterized protein [Drosophila suzukii]|uniref:Uncharacterized protein n=1 Tax=Drosophila suzukii TaxID=28584 RepID=A0ABM4TUQ6_DROSZ
MGRGKSCWSLVTGRHQIYCGLLGANPKPLRSHPTVAAVDVSDLNRSPASASRKETHQPPPAGCNSHTKAFT